MTKDEVHRLYEYDRWANNRVLQALSALTPEQFTRDLGGSFRSVRDTLVHIVGGEWGWITYWKQPSHSPAFLADLWHRHHTLFSPDAFPDLAAVRLKWAEVEKEQTEFVNSVTEEALVKNAPFSHNTTQFGVSDATSGQPLHVSSRSSRRDDAAARCQTSAHRFPRISVGMPARSSDHTVEQLRANSDCTPRFSLACSDRIVANSEIGHAGSKSRYLARNPLVLNDRKADARLLCASMVAQLAAGEALSMVKLFSRSVILRSTLLISDRL